MDRVPSHLQGTAEPLFAFCREIVDATADLVCAFKPQVAYFAAERAEAELEALITYIHREHPGIPVILDAKRNDIGSTAEQYARELFARYGADAATVNPYLGWDSIAPYADYDGRGVVILCLTSNPDSAWLQDHPTDAPAYLRVADMAAQNDRGNLLLVVGATFPEQLGMVRERAPALPRGAMSARCSPTAWMPKGRDSWSTPREASSSLAVGKTTPTPLDGRRRTYATRCAVRGTQ